MITRTFYPSLPKLDISQTINISCSLLQLESAKVQQAIFSHRNRQKQYNSKRQQENNKITQTKKLNAVCSTATAKPEVIVLLDFVPNTMLHLHFQSVCSLLPLLRTFLNGLHFLLPQAFLSAKFTARHKH